MLLCCLVHFLLLPDHVHERSLMARVCVYDGLAFSTWHQGWAKTKMTHGDKRVAFAFVPCGEKGEHVARRTLECVSKAMPLSKTVIILLLDHVKT